MWFRLSESNTLRPQENEVVLLKPALARVSLSLSYFPPLKVASTQAFYSSKSDNYKSPKARQVASRQVKPYDVGQMMPSTTWVRPVLSPASLHTVSSVVPCCCVAEHCSDA
jgi:hypothetical protein